MTELSSARFIYNRWDIIAEYSALNGSTLDKLQRTYAWGVDIAGSLADAGGVGALLQFANSTTSTAFMPSYDGNGNIASLINLGSGALAGAFEYSPFGEMLRDEILDTSVATFDFRFSTKWRDAETGWSNYGRRYYDPRNGRFIGRDPIAEEGGINLYAFCGNNPVDRWDRLGMDTMYYDGSGGFSGGMKGISDNSFMNLLRNYTDQDYPEGTDAGASFGYVGTKRVGGNTTVFTIVVMNSNGTSTHVPVSRDQLARADRLSLESVLATGVTVGAGFKGRENITIGPIQILDNDTGAFKELTQSNWENSNNGTPKSAATALDSSSWDNATPEQIASAYFAASQRIGSQDQLLFGAIAQEFAERYAGPFNTMSSIATIVANAAVLTLNPSSPAPKVLAAESAPALSNQALRGIRSLEKQIAAHEAKLAEFIKNPTVRPGMEGQSQAVIKAAQEARIRHLQREIDAFKGNIEKLKNGGG